MGNFSFGSNMGLTQCFVPLYVVMVQFLLPITIRDLIGLLSTVKNANPTFFAVGLPTPEKNGF